MLYVTSYKNWLVTNYRFINDNTVTIICSSSMTVYKQDAPMDVPIKANLASTLVPSMYNTACKKIVVESKMVIVIKRPA
jgi:hypothetical protein